jgi:hypothetical protein
MYYILSIRDSPKKSMLIREKKKAIYFTASSTSPASLLLLPPHLSLLALLCGRAEVCSSVPDCEHGRLYLPDL